jgi:hypothetical protein
MRYFITLGFTALVLYGVWVSWSHDWNKCPVVVGDTVYEGKNKGIVVAKSPYGSWTNNCMIAVRFNNKTKSFAYHWRYTRNP